MVYHYVVVFKNKGSVFSSRKKYDAHIDEVKKDDLDSEVIFHRRCCSKKDANAFILDHTIAPIIPDTEKIKKMHKFMMLKQNKYHKRGNLTVDEANAYTNNEIDIYTDGFIPDYHVYTDGACPKNGTGNAVGGVGVFFEENDDRNVARRLLPTESIKQTNNAAELAAIIQAMYIIGNDLASGKCITVLTDSKYSIYCATSFGAKCEASNWSDPNTPNKELVKTVYYLFKGCENVRIKHVRAHTKQVDIHSMGNKGADAMARKGALSALDSDIL
jgi:ribonuclease HI